MRTRLGFHTSLALVFSLERSAICLCKQELEVCEHGRRPPRFTAEVHPVFCPVMKGEALGSQGKAPLFVCGRGWGGGSWFCPSQSMCKPVERKWGRLNLAQGTLSLQPPACDSRKCGVGSAQGKTRSTQPGPLGTVSDTSSQMGGWDLGDLCASSRVALPTAGCVVLHCHPFAGSSLQGRGDLCSPLSMVLLPGLLQKPSCGAAASQLC